MRGRSIPKTPPSPLPERTRIIESTRQTTRQAYQEAVRQISDTVRQLSQSPQLLGAVCINIFGEKLPILRYSRINQLLREAEEILGLFEKHRLLATDRPFRLIFGTTEKEEEYENGCYLYIFDSNAIVASGRNDNLLGICIEESIRNAQIGILRGEIEKSFDMFKGLISRISSDKLLDRLSDRTLSGDEEFLADILKSLFRAHGIELVSELDNIREAFIEDRLLLSKNHEIGHSRVYNAIPRDIRIFCRRDELEETAANMHGTIRAIIDLYEQDPHAALRALVLQIFDIFISSNGVPHYGKVSRRLRDCIEDDRINVDRLRGTQADLLSETETSIRASYPSQRPFLKIPASDQGV